MKLLIQLTFNNGLGNLYCGVIEILHFIEHYKNLGYKCELIFSSNGSSGRNKFIGSINFEDIFDISDFKVFDNIRSVKYPITDKNFEGYTYHSTQYGPDSPGVHWWDVFFDENPETVPPKYPYNMETLLSRSLTPKYLPKFNKKVYKKVKNFLRKNKNINKTIQVRYDDYRLNPDKNFVDFTDNLLEKLTNSDNVYHLMSNNQYIIDKVKHLPNIKTYDFKNLDILPNDHSYYFFHTHISHEILLERLYDNLAEMVILSHYDELYSYSSFNWTSTFLYYSMSKKPNQKLININTDLNTITL